MFCHEVQNQYRSKKWTELMGESDLYNLLFLNLINDNKYLQNLEIFFT